MSEASNPVTTPALEPASTAARRTPDGHLDFWLRHSWLLWALGSVVFILDQSSKWGITQWLAWRESWPAHGFFRFTHTGNTGTAFSLFQGNSDVLAVVALLAVALLLWVYWSTGGNSLIVRIALGLQLGGAIGNLADRIRLGYVTDFIDVGPWPIFNVADSAISVGMAVMIWYFFFMYKEESQNSFSSAPASAEAMPASSIGCRRCADTIRYGTVNDPPIGDDSG